MSKEFIDRSFSCPEHTAEALENYLIHGLDPGGFVSAMLAGDLYRAVACADRSNGESIKYIADWIRFAAPHGSWGSYENIENWRADNNGCRTAYAKKIDQEQIVEILMR